MKLNEVKLNFGIEALEWLDDHYEKIETAEGIELASSILQIATDKATGNLSSLSKLIHAGTLTNKKVLGIKEINNEINKLGFEEVDALYNEVFTNFKDSVPVMFRAKKMGWMELMEEAMKE